MSITANSIGINIPQVIVAGIENAVISRGNMKHSLLMAGSVGASNLVPSYATGMWGSSSEKYLAEPLVAGLIYALGSKYIVSGDDKEGSFLKRVAKGFVVGASSAAVSGAAVGVTLAPARISSQFQSAAPGLRSANAPVSTSSVAAPFVVS